MGDDVVLALRAEAVTLLDRHSSDWGTTVTPPRWLRCRLHDVPVSASTLWGRVGGRTLQLLEAECLCGQEPAVHELPELAAGRGPGQGQGQYLLFVQRVSVAA